MRILLTGSSGFIGSALVPELAKENELFTLSRTKADRSKHIQADIGVEGFSSFLPSTIDCVVHLIQSEAYGSFPDGAKDMFSVNVQGTFRLLEWARHAQAKRFIFASSGNVYKWGNAPLTESSEKQPDSFYGATKLAMEQLAFQYKDIFEIIGLRLFTVYGPGQKKMTVANLLQRLVKGEEISIQGGEGPTFSPLAIEDCVEFFKQSISIRLTDQQIALNLAGSEILSIRQMADIFSDMSKIIPRYSKPDGMPKCFASNSKLAEQVLDYIPRISFGTGAQGLVKNAGLSQR